MTLYNVKAFGGESASDLELEKALNARFIAHSRQDLPDALNYIEALQARVKELKQMLGSKG